MPCVNCFISSYNLLQHIEVCADIMLALAYRHAKALSIILEHKLYRLCSSQLYQCFTWFKGLLLNNVLITSLSSHLINVPCHRNFVPVQ